MKKNSMSGENGESIGSLCFNEHSIVSDYYQFKLEDFFYNNRFEIQPFFQRNYVWDNERKSKLIETILLDMPIPTIYTYCDNEINKEVIIDGQQRLTSIISFLKNEFKIKNLEHHKTLEGQSFSDFSSILKYKILNYKLSFLCLKNINDRKIVFDIFKRYNTGGIKLNHQEIRNCIYSGEYNDLIKELSLYEPFLELFNSSKVDRMEKEEFVLRFLALYQDLNKYNGNMNQFLNKHFEHKIGNLQKEEMKKIKQIFKKAVDASIVVFGKNAFKNCIYLNSSGEIRAVMYKTISKPVFDMQMLGFADFGYDLICRNKEQICAKYEELIQNDINMRPYYKKMSSKAVLYRLNKWKDHVESIIEQI